MFKEGIIFFDTLGFGWVVEWGLIQQIYLEYWSCAAPTEGTRLSDLDEPPYFTPG